jgi:sulfur-oxidizing protein SoxZ
MIAGRIQVPATVRRGEAFPVRVLVQHPMETGFRRDIEGREVPRNVIESVVCRVAGREVFRAELGTGVAANPYLAFHAVADASGEIVVEWRDDRGETGRAAAALVVT